MLFACLIEEIAAAYDLQSAFILQRQSWPTSPYVKSETMSANHTLHEKRRLMIGYMAPRHKGGSPVLKTTSVARRPRSQTQEIWAQRRVHVCGRATPSLRHAHAVPSHPH